MKSIWECAVDVAQFFWSAVIAYADTPEGQAKLSEIQADLGRTAPPPEVYPPAPPAAPVSGKRGG